MNLHNETFVEQDIEKFGMGAGVVPFSTDDQGTVRFLLGRERWMPAWKGSCRWSGFEGSRKDRESMQDTAVREFMEESMGVVTDKNTIRNVLNKKKYDSRIVLRISNERVSERYHCTYLTRIPWDETTKAIPETFQARRSEIEHVDRIIQEWKYQRPSIFEDAEVGSIRILKNGGTTQKVVVRRLTAAAPCILRHPWTVDEEDADYISATFYGEEARVVIEWDTLRLKLGRNIKPSHRDCLHVVRDTVDGWNYIQDARVIKDYLEKDQVKWWTSTELLNVLQARGHMGVDRFRPYFMPVLQSLLTFCVRSSYIASVPFVCDPLPAKELCEEVPPEEQ